MSAAPHMKPSRGQETPRAADRIAADPHGAPMMDRVERWMMIFGVLSTAGVTAVLSSDFALGWFEGWAVAQINVALLRRMVRAMLAEALSRGLGTMALTLKLVFFLGLVAGLLWMNPATMLGFGLGYGVTLAGLVVGAVVSAPRRVTVSSPAPARETVCEP